MKHKKEIIIILISMFLITQIIGLFVVNSYLPKQTTYFNETTQQQETKEISTKIPYGMETPSDESDFSVWMFLFSFILAIALIFLIMRLNSVIVMRVWFFVVVSIAIAIAINSLFLSFENPFLEYLALLIGGGFAYFKIIKRNIIVHNLSELLIYPGISIIFISFLNLFWIIILLVLISIYDIVAVWYLGFMQKMANFQMKNAKIFAGFFIPYLSKKDRKKIMKLKKQQKVSKKKKIKIELAILGGGDVVFPLITSGIVLKLMGLLPALIVTFFATISLVFLFLFSERGKSYPAMPFLTIGCLFGLLVAQSLKFLGIF